MMTITVEKAEKDIESIINHTLDSGEETVIVTSKGAIVMVPENDWYSIQETVRLLADKKSLAALLEGHRVRENGGKPESSSISDHFPDV